MNIANTYTLYLQEKIIKDFLQQGIIPTKSQIDEKLEEYQLANPDFNLPFTQPGVYKAEESSRLSASKFNTTLQTMYDDMAVLYTALASQATDITKTFDSISSELNLIKKKTSEVENKVSNLLFLAPDVEGSIDFVSDSFADRLKIDDIRSDVLVDTSAGRITLAANKFSRVNLDLSDSDVQFNVITRNDFLSQELAPNSSLLNAFSDTDNIWSHRVRMRRGVGSVASELILRIPTGGQEVNKIVIAPAASDQGNIATVSIQYSNDGLNWSNTNGENNVRLIGDTNLIFDPVTANYWKFIFNKAGYDEFTQDSYLYEFAAKSIQLYGAEYSNNDFDLTGTLISNALIPASQKPFNKVSLSACEKLPTGCTIRYFVAALSDSMLTQYENGSLNWDSLAFIELEPQERNNRTSPVTIDYSKIDQEIGFDSEHQIDNSIDFRYKNRANLCLNFTVDGGMVRDEIRVLRNLGDNTLPVNETLILNQDRGWTFHSDYYSTEFYVEQESGFTIDLGETSAILDGSTITGRIIIAKGYHKFSTHRDNWRKLNMSNVISTANPDPLYPYNHKYLIEGIGDTLYGSDLSAYVGGITKKEIIDPEDIYAGVTLYWSKTLEEVTTFDYTSNILDDNFNVFTYLKDISGVDRIAVKHTDEPGLMVGENFAIITRSVNGDLHKAVILQAVLGSQDPKLTPILDEYIIKLGY